MFRLVDTVIGVDDRGRAECLRLLVVFRALFVSINVIFGGRFIGLAGVALTVLDRGAFARLGTGDFGGGFECSGDFKL